MIRGPLPLARSFIYSCRLAPRRQRSRHPDMIYAQPEVASKRAGAIVPPGIVAGFPCMQAERVGESPILYVLQGCFFRLGKKNPVLPQARVVYVTLLGRDIELSAKEYGSVLNVSGIQELTQTLQPFKLELIFFRTNHLA